MTYPPQQPGGWHQGGQQPNPYGRQPGGQPQSGGWPHAPGGQPGQLQPGPQPGGWNQGGPQQPGWDPNAPQQPAWDPNAPQQQQPGWDPNAPQQTPGWDQGGQQPPPGWQQPGQFPQQGWQQPGPGQPGFGEFGPQPPKKKKTGLIVGLAVGAVAVAGGVVALVISLSGDDSGKNDSASAPSSSAAPVQPGGPRSSAPGGSRSSAPSAGGTGNSPGAAGGKASSGELFDAVAQAYNSSDGNAVFSMLCTSLTKGQQQPKDTLPPDVQFQLTGSPQDSGDQSTIRYRVTHSGKTNDGTLTGYRQSGSWCIGKVAADHP
ncbi:hypothetical protein ATK36_1012 [Amycolatopsis sulphurea]|uniref:Uncharacterized protein n=1 Tax=Amycolatopsis sulphurea TaxID=76022 RepID=A0A2A9G463_9PSEU|nr:hypothetical protein [Amycolatopsis sulphurea]PFG57429.1 hypothetical protein ATK36_1012 [Amycolatopsis sulphurea]